MLLIHHPHKFLYCVCALSNKPVLLSLCRKSQTNHLVESSALYFNSGLDLLSRTNSTKLMDAIEKAREQSVAIVRMAQNILDSKQVTDILLSVML